MQDSQEIENAGESSSPYHTATPCPTGSTTHRAAARTCRLHRPTPSYSAPTRASTPTGYCSLREYWRLRTQYEGADGEAKAARGGGTCRQMVDESVMCAGGGGERRTCSVGESGRCAVGVAGVRRGLRSLSSSRAYGAEMNDWRWVARGTVRKRGVRGCEARVRVRSERACAGASCDRETASGCAASWDARYWVTMCCMSSFLVSPALYLRGEERRTGGVRRPECRCEARRGG
ncbi:hypothetical protein C8F04DRAFT_86989, partial [Mycena alexandri]